MTSPRPAPTPRHRPGSTRPLLLGVAASVVVLALAGCATGSGDPSGSDAAESPATDAGSTGSGGSPDADTDATTPASQQPLFEPDGPSFERFAERHPDALGDPVFETSVLDEQRGVASGDHRLGDPGGPVTLVLTCDAPSDFAVDVLAKGERIDGFAAGDCGTPPVIGYTTAAIDGAVDVRVSVADGVHYRLAVLRG